MLCRIASPQTIFIRISCIYDSSDVEILFITANELNNADRDELIGIILSLQENIASLNALLAWSLNLPEHFWKFNKYEVKFLNNYKLGKNYFYLELFILV